MNARDDLLDASAYAMAHLIFPPTRRWRHGRWSHVTHGPDDWAVTWNEGGRWCTLSFWRRPPNLFHAYRVALGQNPNAGSANLRLWLGLHLGQPLVVGVEIQLPVPLRLLDWLDP